MLPSHAKSPSREDEENLVAKERIVSELIATNKKHVDIVEEKQKAQRFIKTECEVRSEEEHNLVDEIAHRKALVKLEAKYEATRGDPQSNVSGTLKFFRGGSCLLELSHRNTTWYASNSTIYPPSGPAIKIKTEKDAFEGHRPDQASRDALNCSISNPLQICGTGTVLYPNSGARRKHRNPRQRLAQEEKSDLIFSLRTAPEIRALRNQKNISAFSRKPFKAIKVLSSLLKFEESGRIWKAKAASRYSSKLNKNIRLETVLQKLNQIKRKPVFQIQPWKAEPKGKKNKTRDLKHSSVDRAPPYPVEANMVLKQSSSGKVTKIKSELFQVTETCTAVSLSSSSPGRSGTSTPPARGLMNSMCKAASNPMGQNLIGKMLPVTPTMARIKSDSKAFKRGPLASSSLISPDLQRVRVEIGATPQHPPSSNSMPYSSSPPSSSSGAVFTSPRKRVSLDSACAAFGSPLAKRHRLSTDSRGSACSSDGGGSASSPRPPALRLHGEQPKSNGLCVPDRASSSPAPASRIRGAFSPVPSPAPSALNASPSNNFSIASIMSKEGSLNSPAKKEAQRRLIPPSSMPSPSHLANSNAVFQANQMPRNSPPLVSISTYMSRAGMDTSCLDPGLAHLAGVAADPRLGLTPAGAGYAYSNTSAMASMFQTGNRVSGETADMSLNRFRLDAVSNQLTRNYANWPASNASPGQNMFRSGMFSGDSPARTNSDRSVPSSSEPLGTNQYRGQPTLGIIAEKVPDGQEDAPLDLCTKRPGS